MLPNLVPYTGSDKVLIGDGNKLNVSHIGDASLKTTHGSVKLGHVLVLPSIQKNVLSVSQLTRDESCLFEFTDSEFVINGQKMGRPLATGSRKGNLYAMDRGLVAALVAVKTGKAPKDIWHQRLGHPHPRFLKILSLSIT